MNPKDCLDGLTLIRCNLVPEDGGMLEPDVLLEGAIVQVGLLTTSHNTFVLQTRFL